MLRKKFNISIVTGALIAVAFFLFTSVVSAQELQQFPGKGTDAVIAKGTEVGTGWSTKENPEEAVKEAVDMALKDKKDKTPDFAVIFATSGSDMKATLAKARELFGSETKIYGGTSDSRGVMTDKGYARATQRAHEFAVAEGREKKSLAVMTVTSKDITFGVGSASFSDYPTAQEASKAAVLQAIKDAAESKDEMPKIILITPTWGMEDEVIEGIERVVGKKTPIIGGTAGGPTWVVFGENDVYEKGVSLAVIYTRFPVGYVFEGGFDVKEPISGVVTKVDGQAIVEIDNRPALDAYDEWLKGDIGRLHREGVGLDAMRKLFILHPVYRKYTAPDGKVYHLFSHPWPKDETLKDRSVMTATKIKVGERIYLSRGQWEVFINRIGNLPRNAKINGNIPLDAKPILGIGYICSGVVSAIPETEREKLPLLIDYANNGAPFIAPLSWGEQGYFPGIGNKHGNLLTVFLVISDK